MVLFLVSRYQKISTAIMQNKKIIICDDDPGIIDLLEFVLEETGHNIVTERNSLNIPSLIEKEIPDLLILDLWMPVVSGDQLLRMIRKNPQVSEIPVIIISASRDGEAIANQAGATAFLSKPFDINELIATVELHLS